ncbi:tRNA pseudouridine(38-40) synthase TruA [Naasia lichenicola]|uniref:tRNA pseudouridine synthase A n=1 Tax=Naasia lichenicola TaxID=2565933 RepID=A0A4S4FJF5_9MICO|nr:tRNA pseudouridine(38-40) synthase TruA [Naasia lichenicola]
MTRIRLGVAYDGTGFRGWTRQPGLRTVQGELEAALATLFRRQSPAPVLTVAGRTDAGVHAVGQVAHLDLDEAQFSALTQVRAPRPGADVGELLRRRINGILGASSDVVVSSAGPAPDGFDARFGAVWRRYRYRIADSVEARDPLQRHRTIWHPTALDEAALSEASAAVVGLNDFAAFCKPREGATTIRTLQDFAWHRDADGVLIASLQADAFCHSMVRSLVGAAVAVGEGRLSLDALTGLLKADARSSSFIVMPAKGLTLMEVGYPDDAELAARAGQTRQRRLSTELL